MMLQVEGDLMTANLHEIIDRQQSFAGAVRDISDFILNCGREVSPDAVLASPDWSLYAIDVETERALFVELPAGTDLAQAAFVYMTQYALARRVIIMSLDQMVALSERVSLPENFGILFSTGRCGSTLASRILAQIPDVWSLSEPDVFENLAFARFLIPQGRMIELIRAATRLVFRPPVGRDIRTFVIKPRSESIVQAPEFAKAVPQSRNVFMYRDAEGYVNSLYQFVQKMVGHDVFFSPAIDNLGWPFTSVNAPPELLDNFFPEGRDKAGTSETMAVGWVLRIRAYLDAVEQGLRMQPLHYRDLNTNRRSETARMLQGFAISLDHLDLAMKGFEEDSQKGTGGDRALPAIPMDEVQRARIKELIERWGMKSYEDERLAGSS